MKKLGPLILSAWILYHGLAIILMPSPGSILVQNYGWVFRGYLNQLTINTTWNLFSPEPASSMYGKIQLIDSSFETGEKEINIPSSKGDRNLDPRDRRSYYQFRYLLLDPTRLESFLIPFYCKQKVQEVWVSVITEKWPAYLEAQRNKSLEKIFFEKSEVQKNCESLSET